MDKISVIIPVYNGKDTINKAIASVLGQSYNNFELIIINDGSTDDTLKIINKFQDVRIKVFSFPNAGLAAARNRGIENSTGAFITFLDADDIWTLDKLFFQLDFLKKNPETSVAYSWTDYIDDEGNFLFPGDHISASGDIFEKLILKNFIQGGSNILLKSNCFSEVGLFDESLRRAEDWDMLFRLSRKFKFVSVPRVQIYYRLASSSLSTNTKKQVKAVLVVINRAFSDVPKHVRRKKIITLVNLCFHFSARAIEDVLIRQKKGSLLKKAWCAMRNNQLMRNIYQKLTHF